MQTMQAHRDVVHVQEALSSRWSPYAMMVWTRCCTSWRHAGHGHGTQAADMQSKVGQKLRRLRHTRRIVAR